MLWHSHLNVADEITPCPAVKVGNTQALTLENGPRLCARRNMELGAFSFEGWDFDLPSKAASRKRHLDMGMEVMTIPFETLMGGHLDFDIEIARGAAAPWLAHSGFAQHVTIVDARRNFDLHLALDELLA